MAAAEEYAETMFKVFQQCSNKDGEVSDLGLEALAAYTYHCHQSIVTDMFEHFLYLLEDAGFEIPVEKFQQERRI